MRINTNVASLNAQQVNTNTQNMLSGSLEKLASGNSINKSSDDASGLAIADKLRTQASSLNQGIKNANSGITLIQMADKSMEEQSNILNTIKTKLIQAGTATTSAEGATNISNEIGALLTQLDAIATNTDYNGTTLLQASTASTSTGGDLVFQVGETGTETVTLSRSKAANTASLGPAGSLADIKGGGLAGATGSAGSIRAYAANAMSVIDTALTELNDIRANFGSGQVQLESSVRNQQVAVVSLNNAESVIRDTDYAAESANFNKLNILAQAGMYAISQSNAAQQNVMKLLQ